MKTDKEYIELEYSYNFGLNLPGKLHPDMLPETFVINNPIELQEVNYFSSGKGYRYAYSYRPVMTLNFDASNFSSPLKGKLHQHDYFELILNTKDYFEMQIESQICGLNKWDVLILNRATRHAEFFDSEAKLFYMALSPDYLESMPPERYTMTKERKSLFNFFNKGLCDTFRQNKNYIKFTYLNRNLISPIYRIIENIRQEFESKQSGYQLVIRGMLLRLLSILCENGYYKEEYIDLQYDKGFSIALSAKQLIEKSAGMLTKQCLCDTLNYNSTYINQVFKQHYGYTIAEYRRLIRIKKAAELLTTTDLPIHKICDSLKFANRTNFYHLFKQQYSCSPKEYRDSHSK